LVRNHDDIINAVSNTPKENVVPIFCVSSVSGTGLEEVKRFLHLLPPSAGLKEQEKLEQANPEFQIDEIFDVPHVGCVVGGLVTQGIITEGMTSGFFNTDFVRGYSIPKKLSSEPSFAVRKVNL
jgi:GTPase